MITALDCLNALNAAGEAFSILALIALLSWLLPSVALALTWRAGCPLRKPAAVAADCGDLPTDNPERS